MQNCSKSPIAFLKISVILESQTRTYVRIYVGEIKMKERIYHATRINLSGRADLVLFSTNICVEKQLTYDQAKAAIQKAIFHHLLNAADGKTLSFRYTPEKKGSFTILVEVLPNGK